MAQFSETQNLPFIRLQLSTPIWTPVEVKDLMTMTPNYSRKVQKPFQPTIIDPLRIPECVRNGHYVCVFFDHNDERHWFISTNADVPYPGLCNKIRDEFEMPCCFRREQKYLIEIPWELIGQKKALMNQEGWVVLVDPNFEGTEIDTDQYQIINALCMFII